MVTVPTDPSCRDWVEIVEHPLPVARAVDWATRPGCGSVVTFSGTVRDFSDGRPGVTSLDYEVHPTEAMNRMAQIAESARARWPAIDHLVLWHRIGQLAVTDVAVFVVVATAHRAEGFRAAEYCIDTIKSSVPIWKRETWAGGTDWSVCTHDIADVDA